MKTEEIDIDKEEKILRKIKKKKAIRIDDVPIEAWIYAGEGLRKRLVELLQKVWVARCHKIGRKIVSLYKGENEEKVTNCRDISLQYTAYKIYAEVKYRLEKEVKTKDMISESWI